MTTRDRELAKLLARVLAEVLMRNEKDLLIIIERVMKDRR